MCDGRVDITVGSALDIYGGKLDMDEIIKICG
jgi:phosphoribosylformimino-5-aminoimidazole carboxamide ribotide isomerase